jgi:hypothetical protein
MIAENETSSSNVTGIINRDGHTGGAFDARNALNFEVC